MSINRNPPATVKAGGHWMHLQRTWTEVKGRQRLCWVAVCACSWTSVPQKVDWVAIEEGIGHSNANQPSTRWRRDEQGRPAVTH